MSDIRDAIVRGVRGEIDTLLIAGVVR